ncbi:MAG TPA: CDP-archaeol synthase [Patescibacteria group bacterium]|nr:CDP-archaeol synthase [Patescibacteria group bacterium]
MNDYLAAILFFLPAGVSNMSPVFANKIPWFNKWNTPIDFGKSYKGQRILGDNKRWRGIVAGTLMGGATAVIVSIFNTHTVITIPPFWVGCLLGFGALAGDAIESFFKRLCKVQPGHSWFPFDQIDYILGGLLLVWPIAALPLWVVLTIFITYFGLHLLVAYIAYLLGLKDRPL